MPSLTCMVWTWHAGVWGIYVVGTVAICWANAIFSVLIEQTPYSLWHVGFLFILTTQWMSPSLQPCFRCEETGSEKETCSLTWFISSSGLNWGWSQIKSSENLPDALRRKEAHQAPPAQHMPSRKDGGPTKTLEWGRVHLGSQGVVCGHGPEWKKTSQRHDVPVIARTVTRGNNLKGLIKM